MQGNGLLIGVAGSGKQSLARLAAFAAKQQVYEITLSKGYNENSFREDLKKIYQMLGPDGQQVSKPLAISTIVDRDTTRGGIAHQLYGKVSTFSTAATDCQDARLLMCLQLGNSRLSSLPAMPG